MFKEKNKIYNLIQKIFLQKISFKCHFKTKILKENIYGHLKKLKIIFVLIYNSF